MEKQRSSMGGDVDDVDGADVPAEGNSVGEAEGDIK